MKIKTLFKLFSLPAIACLLCSSTIVLACPTDNTLNKPDIIDKVKQTFQSGITSSKTFDQERRQQKAKTGNAGCNKGPRTNKKINSKAWENIKSKLPTIKETPVLENKSSAEEYDTAIREIFFITPEKKQTASHEDIAKLHEKRREFALKTANKGYYISYNLRKSITDEAKTIKDAGNSTGCNESQLPVMHNMNIQALVKTTVADIIMQIMLMEVEGATELLSVSDELTPYSDPKKEGGK